MLFKKRKKEKPTLSSINPDEIFLDSKNIPEFDRQQFEGRIESPISHGVFLFIAIGFLLAAFFLLGRAGHLQIIKGEVFSARAQNNHLHLIPLSAERGVIYDRKGEALAWNDPAFYLVLEKKVFVTSDLREQLEDFLKIFYDGVLSDNFFQKWAAEDKDLVVGTFFDWPEVNDIYREWSFLPLRIEAASVRSYKETEGLAHVLGYLGCPSLNEIKSGSFAFYEDSIGKSGVEKSYETFLKGEEGYKIIETDSLGEIKSESIQQFPVTGGSIQLSIDWGVQNKIYEIFSNLAEEKGYKGAAAVILDVKTGEILALVSYPEYNAQVLTRGGPKDLIDGYLRDPGKPFLNRSISGLYTPGSVVKPFIALAALNEGVITPEKKIFSSGSISVPNPYFPEEESVFYDWKAHGWVDMEKALAISSNVYFYSLGGGHGDVGGLGIKKIGDYMQLFGLGQETGIVLGGESEGVVPGPGEGDYVWRIGDTYNVSIGQGNFQTTPLQMALATAMLANDGTKLEPHLILGEDVSILGSMEISKEYFGVIKDGMREAVTAGTAQALSGLPVKIAAKTGTAELGSGKFVNSWLTAFWPYENPRFSISIVLEKGDASNLIGGVFAMKQLVEWMFVHTPEYLTQQ